jgi:HD-like signal output (HDOD) protein
MKADWFWKNDMGLLRVDRLPPGAILAEDVRDINARLLLAKGLAIGPQQLRILKMWGVFEVQVQAAQGAETAGQLMDAEQLAAAAIDVQNIFRCVDCDHPAIREIIRLSARHRVTHGISNKPVVLRAPHVETRPVDSLEMLKHLDRIDIKLPEVPALVCELNDIIADPLSSGCDIARVVNKSPSMVALLLKIANSAFYGFRSKIDSVSRAVMLIGSREVSNLALGITIMEHFRGISKDVIDVASFLEHSLACGTVARILAAHGNIAHTEQLLLSGMLHDIGRLILCQYFPHLAEYTLSEAARVDIPLLAAEKAILGCTHAQLGHKLLGKWKLPHILEHNVLYHHNPSSSPYPEMAAAVQMGDLIVHGLAVGAGGETLVPAFDIPAWERVGLPIGAFEPLIKQALYQVEHIRHIF